MSDTTQTKKVSLEQHRLMVERGVKLRKDGLYGWHAKCANCLKVMDDQCRGVEDIETALDEAKHADPMSCSLRCWAESGQMQMFFTEMDDCEWKDRTLSILRRLGVRVKKQDDGDEGSLKHLTFPKGWHKRATDKDLELLRNDIGDFADYEPADNEVGCET